MYFQAKSFEHYSAGYGALPEVLKEQLENVIFSQTNKVSVPKKNPGLGNPQLTKEEMEEMKRNLFVAACFMADVKTQWTVEGEANPHETSLNGADAVINALYPEGDTVGEPGEEQELFYNALEDWREVFFELPPVFVWHFFGVYREHFQDWENAQEGRKGEP